MAVEFGRRSAVVGQVPPQTPFSDEESLARWWRGAVQMTAALLVGFGIILWIAANWDDIPKLHRFAIVGGALVLMVLASLVARIRAPALVGAFLAAGGLFALIGQTYQTGADAWQLFAVWAVLTVPWAFAARHDLLWGCWVLVAMTGLVLWLVTFSSSVLGGHNTSAVLLAWLVALLISALLSHWSPIARWTGEAPWAFRLALLLTIVLIGQGALNGIFAARAIAPTYYLGLLALGGIAAAMIVLRPFEFFLLAFAALAIDVLLICGITRVTIQSTRWDVGSTLLIGLVAAAIVSGTGSLLVRIARQHAHEVPGMGRIQQSMWPVALLSGFGALLASIPIVSFVAFLVAGIIERGPGIYVVGAAALGGACYVLRSAKPTSFVHQLAVVGLVVGFVLLGIGFFRDISRNAEVAALIMALIALGAAFAIGRTWVQAILGTVAATFAAIFIVMVGLPGHVPSFNRLTVAAGVLAITSSGFLLLPLLAGDSRGPLHPLTEQLEKFHEFLGGWASTALSATILAAGPTFLMSGALGWRAPVTGTPTIGVASLAGLNLWSALLAAAGIALLLGIRPWMRTTLGIGASVVAVALAAVIDGLGGLILLGSAAILAGRQALSIGAVMGCAWVIGAFYYWLGWPLVDKAKLMLVAGVLLGVFAWISGMIHKPARLALPFVEPRRSAIPLIVAGAAVILGLAGHSVRSKEQILSSGRQVIMPLAPVDPRSLMQGDYMALRFVMPSDREMGFAPEPGKVLYAVLALDERGVGKVVRTADGYPTVAANEAVILLRPKNGRWIISTDAWFFKEGTGKKWEAARFGVFKVGPDGTALLVNLIDQDLKEIR